MPTPAVFPSPGGSPIVPSPAPSTARPAPAPSLPPFLKWAGGKSRLLTQLRPLLPPGAHLRRHVEPFFGGGALFFALRPPRSLIMDINPALIRTYEGVRDHAEKLITRLQTLAAGHTKTAYYAARDRYNRGDLSDIEHAATFIYLNKTCFNGLHRVNQRGEFNVPMGRYKSPRIVDPDSLRASSKALKRSTIQCAGFETLLESAKPGDFIYLDPPYHPLSDTANFTGYAQGGFREADQVRLRDVFRALDRRGCLLMLSNSHTPFIRELYEGYQVELVAAPRAISCNAARRQRVTEVVVRNYS